MAAFNQVILLGNLTRDPQLTYLPSQTAVVDFGMAISRKYKGQDGQMKEDACFVDLRAFGKSAETINKYCKKGSQLFIEGRLQYDSWTAQDGTKKSKHRITVESFQFLGQPAKTEKAEPQDNGNEYEPAPVNDDIPF
jgi:single-strand DNA-binding protein